MVLENIEDDVDDSDYIRESNAESNSSKGVSLDEENAMEVFHEAA